MNYKQVREIIDAFLNEVKASKTRLTSYDTIDFNIEKGIKTEIDFQLNKYKEIVLDSETGLELGGINNKSFSLVYPIKSPKNRNISNSLHIIGPEVEEIDRSSVDFCLFIILTVNDLKDEIYRNLKSLTFISDSIEGFAIRSIPRRFWCRVSHDLLKKDFSFRFLGEAIGSLYLEKLGPKLNSIEIIMINSFPNMIDELLGYTEQMRADLITRWRAKVETWKKRIDCDYEWACKVCPYFISCQKLQGVLELRKDLE